MDSVERYPVPAAEQRRQPSLRFAGIDWRAGTIQYGLALVTVLLVLGPILPVVYQSLIDRPIYAGGGAFTAGNYTKLFANQDFAGVIGNSFVFATASTVISQLLGAVVAILIGRTNMPGARLFGGVLLWPLYISGLVYAFGWFIAYGPTGYVTLLISGALGFEPWNLYSIAGMSLISGVSSVPITVLFCLSSTALADSSLEDAARVSGARPARIMWSITLPMLLPALAYSAILNFMGALEALSIPLILGEPVGIKMFMTFIYNEGLGMPRPDYGIVGTATVILLVVVGLLIFLQERLLGNTRRFVTVGGKATVKRSFDLGPMRWPCCALMAAFSFWLIVLPIGFVILRGFVSFITPLIPMWELLTLDHYRTLFSLPANIRGIANTLGIAAIGGAVATLLYALIALVAQRSEFRFRTQLKYLALLPRAVPGMIAGIGVFYAMLALPFMQHLAGTFWIILIAYIARYIPTGFGVMSPALLQIGPDLDRAARTMGAGWWTTSRTIMLKLLSPAMFAAYSLLFISFLKEYATAAFLFAPGTEVIGTIMLRYWSKGDVGPMAALSAIQICLTIGFMVMARHFWGVRLYR